MRSRRGCCRCFLSPRRERHLLQPLVRLPDAFYLLPEEIYLLHAKNSCSFSEFSLILSSLCDATNQILGVYRHLFLQAHSMQFMCIIFPPRSVSLFLPPCCVTCKVGIVSATVVSKVMIEGCTCAHSPSSSCFEEDNDPVTHPFCHSSKVLFTCSMIHPNACLRFQAELIPYQIKIIIELIHRVRVNILS